MFAVAPWAALRKAIDNLRCGPPRAWHVVAAGSMASTWQIGSSSEQPVSFPAPEAESRQACSNSQQWAVKDEDRAVRQAAHMVPCCIR